MDTATEYEGLILNEWLSANVKIHQNDDGKITNVELLLETADDISTTLEVTTLLAAE